MRKLSLAAASLAVAAAASVAASGPTFAQSNLPPATFHQAVSQPGAPTVDEQSFKATRDGARALVAYRAVIADIRSRKRETRP